MFGVCTPDQSAVPLALRNDKWWRHGVYCMLVEEVSSKGKQTPTEQFYRHHSDGNVWIKTSLLLLESPPEQVLKQYLDTPVHAFTETRQYWSYLPFNDLTYHAFTTLETKSGDLYLQLEKKDSQLELMIAKGQIALSFMKEFRAIGRARRLDRCVAQPRRLLANGLTVRKLLEWIDGPLSRSWQPYDLMWSNCQHFTSDLHQFLLNPHLVEGGPGLPREHLLLVDRVRDNPRILPTLPSHLLTDRRFVLAAVARRGKVLQFVARPFKRDWGVVKTAVIQDGLALEYAADELRRDKELVLAAVKENGMALQFAGQNQQADMEVVMAAVQKSGSALQFAAPGLRQHHRAAFAATWQDPLALQYVLT